MHGRCFSKLPFTSLLLYAVCAGFDIPLSSHGNGSKELDTCMGDLFSVSWMEDSEKYDPAIETLRVSVHCGVCKRCVCCCFEKNGFVTDSESL